MTGEEIKEKRNELGLTQTELADKLGVSKNTIVNWEKGGVIPKSKQSYLKSQLEKLQYLTDKQIDILDKTNEKYQNWDVDEVARFFQMNQEKLLKNKIIKEIIEKHAYKKAFELVADKLTESKT